MIELFPKEGPTQAKSLEALGFQDVNGVYKQTYHVHYRRSNGIQGAVALTASFPKDAKCFDNADRCNQLFAHMVKAATFVRKWWEPVSPYCRISDLKADFRKSLFYMQDKNIQLDSPSEYFKEIKDFEKALPRIAAALNTTPWLKCDCFNYCKTNASPKNLSQ